METKKQKNKREKTTFHFKTSRISFIGNYFSTFFLIVIMIVYDFLFGIPQPLKYILLFLVLLLLVEPEYEVMITDYMLEEQKVVEIKGFIAKKTTSIPYDTISQIVLNKGVVGRILNFGNIVVTGFAGPQNVIILKGLSNPEKCLKIIEDRMKIHKKIRLK